MFIILCNCATMLTMKYSSTSLKIENYAFSKNPLKNCYKIKLIDKAY